MWWRILITFLVTVLLALSLGKLAADGTLGRYGWSIAMIVGSAIAGGVGSALLTPVVSLPARWPRGRARHMADRPPNPRD
jgi:hypothetical protein